MENMKKLFLVPALLSLVGCYTSSGSYVTRMCVTTQNDHSFSMSYDYFKGHKSFVYNIKANTEIDVNFKTESGKLECFVKLKDGDYVYRGNEIETSSFKIVVPKDGRYEFRFDAVDHKGSFSCSWTK